MRKEKKRTKEPCQAKPICYLIIIFGAVYSFYLNYVNDTCDSTSEVVSFYLLVVLSFGATLQPCIFCFSLFSFSFTLF